ncbi:pullulanase [Actinobaculum suis]|uniref:Alpha-amylase n=1 Tax=Actinobaculum suis TaxID=1657 RepID=A0A1G7E7V5_9ACTO|nr:pullulanase [Actinobaculum suis]
MARNLKDESVDGKNMGLQNLRLHIRRAVAWLGALILALSGLGIAAFAGPLAQAAPETPADIASETPAVTASETPADTTADTTVDTPAGALPEKPAETPPGIPADTTAEMPSGTAPAAAGEAPVGRSGVVVTLFQHPWNSVAKECTQTLGPAGVAYVQVSPPQETIKGSAWWTSYQPVSYQLESKLGTAAEFQQMINTCRAAGVGVIVDAVINHTTGVDREAGTGIAGSSFDAAGNYPQAGYGPEDFHKCTENISDYRNAENVWNCRLSGLQDLDTGSEKVRDRLGQYFADLLGMGVAGFRVDAVKHMSPEDVAAIKEKAAEKVEVPASRIWWMQEVIGNPGEAPQIQPSKYTGSGEVTEFSFAYQLRQRFKGSLQGGERKLSDIASGLVPSQQATVFVDNWDTERGEATLSYKDGRMYQLANAFLLGYGYGTPNVYSGYQFTDADAGAPGASETAVPETSCGPGSGWNCTQRWTAIRGMIAFHNATAGEPVQNWQDDGDNNIAFERGQQGFLALNNTAQPAAVSYHTSLPNGTYCNVYAAGDCSQTVAVKDGKIATEIQPRSAVALIAGVQPGSDHPAARGAASDPADPQLPPESNTPAGPADPETTIFYKPESTWTAPYLHYGRGDAWTQVPGQPMQKVGDGWYSLRINTAQATEFVFNNGAGVWDNPAGGGNYRVEPGTTYAAVADKQLSFTNPVPPQYEPKTRVIVHYAPAAGDTAGAQRGVYLWGNDKEGNTLAGKHYQFTGEDSFGKVFETEIPGAYEPGKLGFIVTTPAWDKDGGDRMLDASSGTAEVWITGGSDTTATQAPAQYQKRPAVLDVKVHYLRPAGDYQDWDLWTWAEGLNGSSRPFNSHDDWGKLATFRLESGSGIASPSFIVREGADAWKSKDPGEGDRVIPQSAITITDPGGNGTNSKGEAEIWLVSGDWTVYTNPSVINTKRGLVKAEISGLSQITARLAGPVDPAALTPQTVQVAGAQVANVELAADKSAVVITTAQPLDVAAAYQVSAPEYGEVTASAGAVVRTPEFDAAYAYSGALGAQYEKTGTTFALWAPTAAQVHVRLYKTTDREAPLATEHALTRGEKGVWQVRLPGDLDGTAYDFRVTFANGTENLSPDPYAHAAVENGMRSVVLSPESASRGAQGERMPAFGPATNASIAEMNIRDFSIQPDSGISAAKRGKYLGVVEGGTQAKTGNPSGLDYLKQLGVTHVQIMPFYDFGSVDESGDLGYAAAQHGQQNWGYDPENYNVPEGSYASDPADPKARLAEAKQMVAGLHKAGLRVIMDVVYNHVYNPEKHAFNLTVPGYYFRYDAAGKLVNNSGVGNDTASERAMMRKYIVDSVVYWATEYGVDGFRFDLMGLHDVETMREVRAALNQIDPSIIVLGEGWDMNRTLPKDAMAIQPNAGKLAPGAVGADDNGVAFFNDSIRDGLKGSVFEASDTGFVSGKSGQETLIANNVLGCQKPEGLSPCTNGNANTGYAAPGQIVNYVEIHDNLTLFDKLLASRPDDSEQTRAARAKLANSTVYLAQGIPAAQLGQEFLRTKGGDENSYNSGDGPNAIDWSRAHEQADSVAYTRGLLALRQSAPAFRYPTFEQVNANSKLLRAADGVVAWTVRDTEHSYVVVLNSTDAAVPVDIPAGTYDLLVANGKVELSAPQTVTIGETPYAAGALSATVLRLHTDNAGEPGAEDADQTGAEDAGQAGAEDAGQTGAEGTGIALVLLTLD